MTLPTPWISPTRLARVPAGIAAQSSQPGTAAARPISVPAPIMKKAAWVQMARSVIR